MTKNLIDREEACQKILDYCGPVFELPKSEDYIKGKLNGLRLAAGLVGGILPVNVKEEIHSRWKFDLKDDNGTLYWKCDNCDKIVTFTYDYCPYCGAEMDE